MADLPSVAKRIQVEETQALRPVSESTAQKMGSTMNYLLDNYAIPPGTIIDYAGSEATVPPGWLIADGRAVSRTTYANLFTAIGTLWGTGDGVSTFNMPDLRGLFTRMVDQTTIGAAGRDPDVGSRVPVGTGTTGEAGSYQQDQFRSHTHQAGAKNNGVFGAGWNEIYDANEPKYTSAAGGNETRPKNAYVLKIIKT